MTRADLIELLGPSILEKLEARGLRVVPATPINKVREAMDAAKGKSATSPEYFAVSFALSEMTVAMLAASPFAPEEKP